LTLPPWGDQFRDYILHVKTRKAWKPETIRHTVASARIFYIEMLGHEEWKVFSQIRTKDHDELPDVLARDQVHRLLRTIRLRRYRTPVKLIYCAWRRGQGGKSFHFRPRSPAAACFWRDFLRQQESWQKSRRDGCLVDRLVRRFV